MLAAMIVATVALAAASPRVVDGLTGTWMDYIASLPNRQLPHVPLLGNGRIGVALDSHRAAASPSRSMGPGAINTLDIWISSNGFWSCRDRSDSACSSVDPDNDVTACCSTVALGGVSLRFSPTFGLSLPLPIFTAQQIIAAGALATNWTTPEGGLISTITRMHPSDAVVATTVTWSPAASDPQDLIIDVSTWVLGDGSVSGSSNTGNPAPASIGCASLVGEEQPCQPWSAAPPPQQQQQQQQQEVVFLSRNASTVSASVMPVTAALATAVVLQGASSYNGANVTSVTPTSQPPSVPWEVTQRLVIPSGSSVVILTAEAESRGPTLSDPSPQAVQAVLGFATAPAALIAEADAWWNSFWAASAISLPTRPDAEALWFGSQYILACSSSTQSSPDIPAPGLYGPWVTVDGPNWHGDYTLDYNYQAPYFGAFGSNHPEVAEGYWRPILDWLPAARTKAQAQAALAHVQCPSNAAYYACHLAPWGLMSLDGMTRYMSWNGHFAALLFINHWEYTLNATFAEEAIYPLLDSLNAWWGCYLNRTIVPNGYVYEDTNQFNPDYEHEGQVVPNPQIALAFIHRTVAAQLDLAAQLGVTPPPLLVDIAQHLPPFNNVPINVSTNVSFAVFSNTRCHDDSFTWGDVLTLEACEARCTQAGPSCAIFSYCPPTNMTGCSGQNGQPKPYTCWGYTLDKLPLCVTNATINAGWTSGLRNSSSATTIAVWTAFSNASVSDSDEFAMHPMWPTEAIAPLAMNSSSEVRATAQASSWTYSSFATGRPVDLFPAAVSAGANASASYAWTAQDILDGLSAYLANFFGPNLLPYAPGGGIENTGIVRALNEMLVRSDLRPGTVPPVFTLRVFPVWPAAENASFTSLLTKGGFLVSAAWDGDRQQVSSPIGIEARFVRSGLTSSTCTLADPWGAGPSGNVSVQCGGSTVPITWIDNDTTLQFSAPQGIACQVSESRA